MLAAISSVVPHGTYDTLRAPKGDGSGGWDCLPRLCNSGSFTALKLHPRAHLLYLKYNVIALVHTVMVTPESYVITGRSLYLQPL